MRPSSFPASSGPISGIPRKYDEQPVQNREDESPERNPTTPSIDVRVRRRRWSFFVARDAHALPFRGEQMKELAHDGLCVLCGFCASAPSAPLRIEHVHEFAGGVLSSELEEDLLESFGVPMQSSHEVHPSFRARESFRPG